MSAFVDPEVLERLKEIIVEQDSTIQETLVQLISNYFVAHGRPPIAEVSKDRVR